MAGSLGGGGANAGHALGMSNPLGAELAGGGEPAARSPHPAGSSSHRSRFPPRDTAARHPQSHPRGEQLEEAKSEQVSGFLGASTGVLSVTIRLTFLRMVAGSSKISIVLL